MPRKRAIPAAVLHNAASNMPLARLRAIHELRQIAQRALDETFDALELEQVRQARAGQRPASWEAIGIRIGVTHTQARRRYLDRL